MYHRKQQTKKTTMQRSQIHQKVSVNFSNCKTEIKTSLINAFSDWCNKRGVLVKYLTEWISLVMEKVYKRIKELKDKFKFSKVRQVLKHSNVISYLKILQEQYVMCPIGKAENNIAFICKIYSIS